jgi:hypothetical protein
MRYPCGAFAILLAWILSCVAVPVRAAEVDEALFAAAVHGHKQWIETATRHLHVKYTRTQTPWRSNSGAREGERRQSTEWWQNGDDVRATNQTEAEMEIPVAGPTKKSNFGTVKKTVEFTSFQGNRQTIATIAIPGNKQLQKDAHKSGLGGFHAYGIDLWTATGHRTSTAPVETWLYEHLQQPGRLRTCKWTNDGSRRVVLIEKDCEKGGIRVVFDPMKGFLPIKLWIFASDGACDESQPFSFKEVKSFLPPDPKNGLEFPSEVLSTYYSKKNTTLSEARTIVELAEIGKPFSDSVFQVKIPAGYIVVDESTDKVYKSDGRGQPASGSPAQRLSELQIPRVYEEPPDTDGGWSVPYRWIAIAGACLFFAAAGYLWWRRRAS